LSVNSTHLSALSVKHAKLEASIEAEGQRPKPDTIRMARLKREKLKIKEEMTQLH
jgi:hypothetical protein